MPFEIYFTGQPDEYLEDDPTVPSAVGRIVAGELIEEFSSSLYEWNKLDYESQWFLSLEHLLNGGDRAVLITFYVNPRESSNLHWWALYRGETEIVHVQDHLPWYDMFEGEFSAAKACSFLKDRETVNEDGITISEWDIPLAEVRSFFEKLKKQKADFA